MRTERTNSLAAHRVAILRPFASFLGNVGAPVESWLRKADIPATVLEHPHYYIPSARFFKFVINAARNSGIQDLGSNVGSAFGPSAVDAQLTRLLNRSPTLYAGLLVASDLMNKSVTNTRIGVMRSQDGKHILFYHRPSCGLQHPANEQIGSFGLMILIEIVRKFTGPEWLPGAVGLMMSNPQNRRIQEGFPGARIRTSPTYGYIAVDNALLGNPPRHPEDVGQTPPSLDCEAFAPDVANSVTQVLRTYLNEPDLSLGLLAELFNTSPRTLQRKLADAGTSYSKVLEQARIQTALSMLKKPGCTVTEVSCYLGYSDPTNFARTFRRATGVSPREYHQQHASGS
jgi:AraC-like DNA-binding protein